MDVEKKRDDIFFVGIRDPVETRRNVLEALKGTVEDLQRFEKFKTIREQKTSTIIVLKSQVKEIQKLTNKLKLVLPKGDMRVKLGAEHAKLGKKVAVKKKKAVKKAKKEVVKEQPVAKPKELSELEKLEAELSNIENKLGGIS